MRINSNDEFNIIFKNNHKILNELEHDVNILRYIKNQNNRNNVSFTFLLEYYKRYHFLII